MQDLSHHLKNYHNVVDDALRKKKIAEANGKNFFQLHGASTSDPILYLPRMCDDDDLLIRADSIMVSFYVS